MDWTTVVTVALFTVACILAVYRSRRAAWELNRKLGTAIFLAGAAVGLFLDDLLASYSWNFPWLEPIAAIIMIGGLLVSRFS